jgi:glycerate kinase
MNLNVLIVPDKFKGTLTSPKAAQALAAGWRQTRPGDHLELLPMCDGGDGFGEVIASLTAAKRRSVVTLNARHERCLTPWWLEPKTGTAIIEAAQTIGLSMLAPPRPHPFLLDTRGLGILLALVARHGVRRCLVGLGGSATNDGGFGMAPALGWEFLDRRRNPIERWTHLNSLVFLRPPPAALKFDHLLIAADVQNPLLGPRGATRIFGPQKGLSPADLPIAERALRHLARVTRETLGQDISQQPGAGAAGGLGFACLAFLGAQSATGFEIFAQYSDLHRRLQSADLVLTGEGQIDPSTLMGKGVGSLAQLCQAQGIPCLGFAGTINQPDRKKLRLFNQVYALTDITTLDQAKSHPAPWLQRLASEAARWTGRS